MPSPAGAAAWSCGFLVPSALVGRAVLSWLAPTLPRVRYKILPARLLGGQNGTKLSLHAETAPNRAISGEQGEFCTAHAVRVGERGEFCTAHAVRRGVLGEFCPAHAVRVGERGEFCTARAARRGVLGEFCPEGARRGCCWANNVVLWCSPCASWRAMAAPWRCSRALRPGSPAPGALHAGGGGGFAPCEAFLRRVVGVSQPCMASFPPIGGDDAAT